MVVLHSCIRTLVLSISSVNLTLVPTIMVVYVDEKVKGQFNLKSKARTKSVLVRRYSIKANQFIVSRFVERLFSDDCR